MRIFNLPDLGEGLTEAEIHEWFVNEGDMVKADQPMVSMETAKAVVDVPAPFSGRVEKLYGKVGDIIPTGSPLIAFSQTESSTTQDAGTVVGEIQTSETILEEAATGIEVSQNIAPLIKAIPAVRALANKLHIDLNAVKGTGPQGSITREDVERAANSQSSDSKKITLQGARRTMIQSMAKAHAEVVPVTLHEDADIFQWNEQEDITVRLIRAVQAACVTEPLLNAHFHSQTTTKEIFKFVNLGIAVDTPDGLYVPVIKDIANLDNKALREKLEEFKDKAKKQTFSPSELKGATITLSNFGSIAGRYANPIIVPPTVAIIGIGKKRFEVVPHNNQAVIHPIIPISLSFDHRAATGGEASRFLAAFIKHLAEKTC